MALPASARRPLESRSDEELRKYHDLCGRMLREQISKRDQARHELEILSKGAAWNKVKVFGGVLIFAGGLATTAAFGPVGAVVTVLSGAATLDPVVGVVKQSNARARLRLDVIEYEESITFWSIEQARTISEVRRRRGNGL